MKRKICILLSLCMCVLFGGCGKKADTGKRTVYVSFYAMYDFAKTITDGTDLEICQLVPSGTEPHDWEPTAADIVNLSNAVGIIYNGHSMETGIDKIKQSVPNVPFLEAAADIESNNSDPHIWLNPNYAKSEMKAITDFLCGIDKNNADTFKKNYNAVSEKLDSLDNDYKTGLSDGKKDIIVTHGAYGYLCNAYGLNQIAVEGLTGESDPSPEKISSVVDFARQNDVKYIFYTNGESTKTAEIIAKETGGMAEELNAFEFDAKNRDYITVMRENLEKLKKALAKG